MTDFDWRLYAACRGMDPDLWFPEKGDGISGLHAIAVCRTCPVRNACLRYALDARELYGIWGGLTISERRHLRAGRQPRERRRTINTAWKDTSE